MKVYVECEGISPILMNPVTDELLEELRTRTPRPKKTDWTAEQEAKEKIYRDNGKIGLPTVNVYSCLVEAGRWIPLMAGKRRNISTADSTVLPALLQIEETFLPFTNHSPMRVDKRRGRNPKDKVMVCIVRPRFDEWEFGFTLLIDETQIAEERARQLVDIAGSRIGLCDFRPACRGPFGRFQITKWEVLEGKKEKRSEGHEEAGVPAPKKRGRPKKAA